MKSHIELLVSIQHSVLSYSRNIKNHLLNNNWKSGSSKTCSMKSFALVPLWYGFFFLNMFKAFDKPEISSLPEFLKRNVFIHLMEDIIIKSPQNSCWSDSFFSFAALFIIQSLPPALNSCLILRYPLHTGQSINGPHPHLTYKHLVNKDPFCEEIWLH